MAELNDRLVDELLAHLTLEEKASLTVGRDRWSTQPIDRLGIPSIWLADGPTGVRKVGDPSQVQGSLPATCFPTESALAASWDVELVRDVGRAVGAEAQAQGVQILLAPGVNLKRSPLCGRNFEYFSEDPTLSAELAAAFIEGVQSQGVGTSLKHFVANENETGRLASDSVVDERTLRELYLRPFEVCVERAHPWTIMAAYNRLNGTFCSEHRWLLSDVLRAEWRYGGVVVSDWFAVNDRIAGLEAGLHLQMPGGSTSSAVVLAVRSGRLDAARLDELVRELLSLILKADAARRPDDAFDADAHHRLARRAAAESVVLLKNEAGLLPLEGDRLKRIAIVGALAKAPRFQGVGSSEVAPTTVENAYDDLVSLVGPETQVTFATGYGPEDESSPALLEEAKCVARRASVALVFAGLPAAFQSEGADRPHLGLPPAHDALIEAVLEVQANTVVVVSSGSAVTMPWVARAPAIVEAWLGGQAGGGAVVDVLLGRVNPSGKLAETFPVRLADTPSYLSFPDDGHRRVRFAEGLFVGYRWYDAREIDPLFPFGHGLSYTRFTYEDISLDREILGSGEPLEVSVVVRNTGVRAGRETVQLYVHERKPRVPRAVRELKAFVKVSLEPGEATAIRIQLTHRDFAVFDPEAGGWLVNPGVFDILAGASSRDIRLQASVFVQAEACRIPLLNRLSLIREWLDHPIGKQLMEPVLASSELSAIQERFLNDLPVIKLTLLGVLSVEGLNSLITEANELGRPVQT